MPHPDSSVTPFVDDPDFQLYVGDALDMLRRLPNESVHCCVTSPPYWGLRDYGTGKWEGGDPEHAHETKGARGGRGGSGTPGKQTEGAFPATLAVDKCSCGAQRVDHQLGLEATPDEYVVRMEEVFREVRRILRADGTCWLNLGDSYASAPNGNKPGDFSTSSLTNPRRQEQARPGAGRADGIVDERGQRNRNGTPRSHGLKQKDLVGIPWRVAFALQEDGWYLRSDIIWAKPNPMPESVTDRPTKSHEMVFLLTKSARYFYDADAIREPAEWARWGDQTVGPGSNPSGWIQPKTKRELLGETDHRVAGLVEQRWRKSDAEGKNGRNVQETNSESERRDEIGGSFNNNSRLRANVGRNARSVWEIATRPYPEAHFAVFPEELARRCIAAGCPADGIVLDPFLGSGTTAFVARRLGRKCVGIELSADYCALAARRLGQQSLLAPQTTAWNRCPFCGARCKGDTCQAHRDVRDSYTLHDDRENPCKLCGWTICACPADES